jgi:hypothetical protein
MQIMSNAAYIQSELPSLTLPEGMSEQIAMLCDSLIATKHDVRVCVLRPSSAMRRGTF